MTGLNSTKTGIWWMPRARDLAAVSGVEEDSQLGSSQGLRFGKSADVEMNPGAQRGLTSVTVGV